MNRAEAWATVVEHRRIAYDIAWRTWERLGRPWWTTVEDIAEIALLGMFHGAETFREGRAKLSTWMYQMGKWTVWRVLRRDRVQPVPVEEVPAQSNETIEQVEQRDELRRVMRVVPRETAVRMLATEYGYGDEEYELYRRHRETNLRLIRSFDELAERWKEVK